MTKLIPNVYSIRSADDIRDNFFLLDYALAPRIIAVIDKIRKNYPSNVTSTPEGVMNKTFDGFEELHLDYNDLYSTENSETICISDLDKNSDGNEDSSVYSSDNSVNFLEKLSNISQKNADSASDSNASLSLCESS